MNININLIYKTIYLYIRFRGTAIKSKIISTIFKINEICILKYNNHNIYYCIISKTLNILY